MRTTLVILVVVIVVLITALVVLTIFGGGIGRITPYMDPVFACQNICEASCQATGDLPVSWNAGINQKGDTCQSLCPGLQCQNNTCTGTCG